MAWAMTRRKEAAAMGRTDNSRRIAYEYVAALLLCLAILGCGIWYAATARARHDRDIAEARHRVDELHAQIAAVKAAADQAGSYAVYQNTGADPQRIEADKEILDRLFRTALTWDGGDAYAAAREAVKDQYGLPEDGRFLSTFMPEVEPDADGENPLDANGINSGYAGSEIYLTDIEAGKYKYIVLAKFRSRNANEYESTGMAVGIAETDADGNVTDAAAYTGS